MSQTNRANMSNTLGNDREPATDLFMRSDNDRDLDWISIPREKQFTSVHLYFSNLDHGSLLKRPQFSPLQKCTSDSIEIG